MSNTIAYGGELIVYGIKHEGDFPGQNCWIDVRSGQSQDNWVPAEGTALAQLLRELAEQHVAPQNIRVISPFRDVVRNAKEIGRRQFDDAFADNNVGTIHTVQGKEADLVVLVLAAKLDVRLAVSTPCFEVWLLLLQNTALRREGCPAPTDEASPWVPEEWSPVS